MNDLLNLTDEELLLNDRVKRAYWALISNGDPYWPDDAIPVSIHQAAFEMRDACHTEIWLDQMFEVCDGLYEDPLAETMAVEWIIAATLAYEEMEK